MPKKLTPERRAMILSAIGEASSQDVSDVVAWIQVKFNVTRPTAELLIDAATEV